MIRLERTFDLELVARIMTHPRLYPHLSDDWYPAPENFWPLSGDGIFHLLVYACTAHNGHQTSCALEGCELLGLYITHPINQRLWEVHHAILPSAWNRTDAIGAAFETWLWANTHATTAVGFTPANNRLALRYARRRGMTEAGRIPNGLQRGGKLHDLVVFTKSRA